MISARVKEEFSTSSWNRDDFRGCDDELWRTQNRVEWRKHDGKICKAFSGECLQSLWAVFEPDLHCIVIRESSRLRIYAESGQEYLVALPMPISKVWKNKYGIVLEREKGVATTTSNATPMLLALHHPLDDLTRVISRTRKNMNEWTTDRFSLVASATEPSMVITYDHDLGQHSAWFLRPVTDDDLLGQAANQTSIIGTPLLRHHGSGVNVSRHHLTQLFNISTPGGGVSTVQSMVSSSASKSRPNTAPSSPQHSVSSLAQICRSPSMSLSGATRSLLPPASTPCNMSFVPDQTVHSLPPDISLCLEHVWTEPQRGRRQASKAFFSWDMVGHSHLSYMVQSSLICVRYDEDRTFATANVITNISDAVAVPGLGMVLVLDASGQTISLYAGVTRVGRVHFNASPCAQMAHIANEIATLHLADTNAVMTSSRPPSAVDANFFNDSSLVLLSPVTNPNSSSSANQIKIARLHEVPGSPTQEEIGQSRDTVLVEYENGASLRIGLPEMATSGLVSRCLEGLKAGLTSPESAACLLSQWYCVRNAPGPTSLSNRQEWDMFVKCLMGLIGYHTDSLVFASHSGGDNSVASVTSPPTNSKKMKHSEQGSDGDWLSLLKSQRHNESGGQLSYMLGIGDVVKSDVDVGGTEKSHDKAYLDSKSALFQNVHAVVNVLHLLYEDGKLDKSKWEQQPLLAQLLSRITADLGLDWFVKYYWQDFPSLCPGSVMAAKTGQVTEGHLKKLSGRDHHLNGQLRKPISIFNHLKDILGNKVQRAFPILAGLTERSRQLLTCYALFAKSQQPWDQLYQVMPTRGTVATSPHSQVQACRDGPSAQNMVDYLVACGYNHQTIQTIPVGIAIPILSALYECRLHPPKLCWSTEAYEMIGRPELARPLGKRSYKGSQNQDENRYKNLLGNQTTSEGAEPVEDGLEDVESEVTRLRWPKDKRVQAVRRLLQSARPVVIAVQQRPEVSDHDFVEEQERCLQSLCVRTMALPVGRGAMGFQTTTPLPTEPVTIPRLCLSGRSPPRGATVEMDHIDVVPNMDRWPSFHNGVAAGLRMSSSSDNVDSNWITFNKPRENGTAVLPNDLVEHGGFLMALGLNGHLAKLGRLESFDYLIRGNDMISIGLLLGVSAAKRGSMDVLATKKISTQLEALLPATATELPLSHTTQVAGLTGLGLLYQGTGHRHMAEVCLGELARPPGPELENCTDRESYSLSAGLALGMITLEQGLSLSTGSLADLNLAETLYHHMVGGPRVSSNGNRSYQVQEGDTINVDVTSPGATLALGLMYLRSGDKRIAAWLDVPDSQFLLEFVRPDFLMLRTLAKGLILWDDVQPSHNWIVGHVPASILPHCMVRPTTSSGVDYETINQAYCNIVAGAALAMGIRFAGSANAQAFEVLHTLAKNLIATSKRSVSELAGKATMEQAICIVVLSLSLVMAGTGDLDVIRLVRYLRSRVGAPKYSTVTYGSHMALHMALGILFLGGGRYTLNTKPASVAALIGACFPKFPTHSNDNRYHLQALRHLYILAAEPRLVIPRDVSSGSLVFAHIRLDLKETAWYKGCTIKLKAPCLVPELELIHQIAVEDERYHPVVLDCQRDLSEVLSVSMGFLDVKGKAGCLPYKDDPQGFRSLTAQCLTSDTSFQWKLSASSGLLSSFSSVPGVSCFSDTFLRPGCPDDEVAQQIMGSILYECASHEKLDLLPFWISAFQLLWQLNRPGHYYVGAQLAMLLTVAKVDQTLVCPEIVTSIYQGLKAKLDGLLQKKCPKEKPGNCDLQQNLLAFEDIDYPAHLQEPPRNPLEMMAQGMSGKCVHTLVQLK